MAGTAVLLGRLGVEVSYVMGSAFEEADEVIGCIIGELQITWGMQDEEILFCIRLVLRELLNNAVEHGNGMDGSKRILCRFTCTHQEMLIMVQDEGSGFLLEEVLREEVLSDLERNRNRGLEIVRKMGFDLETEGSCVKARWKGWMV